MCSMKRLMVPPLPAASRPSNSMTMRWPVSSTQRCAFSSSRCSSQHVLLVDAVAHAGAVGILAGLEQPADLPPGRVSSRRSGATPRRRRDLPRRAPARRRPFRWRACRQRPDRAPALPVPSVRPPRKAAAWSCGNVRRACRPHSLVPARTGGARHKARTLEAVRLPTIELGQRKARFHSSSRASAWCLAAARKDLRRSGSLVVRASTMPPTQSETMVWARRSASSSSGSAER